jgi:hypothetical protein
MNKLSLSLLLTINLSTIYADSAVEKALINTTQYPLMGTFSSYNFADASNAFDWAFTMRSTGKSYQLQGNKPTSTDVFGWKEVTIVPPTPAWYMFQLNGDIDGDGSTKFDWVLVSTDSNNKAAYKLAGVTKNGTFEYSSKLNIDYRVNANTITTGPVNSLGIIGDTLINSDVKINTKKFNTALKNYANSLGTTMDGVYEALKSVSHHYTKNVVTEDINIDDAHLFYATLLKTLPSLATTMLYNRDAVRLGHSITFIQKAPKRLLFAAFLATTISAIALYEVLTPIIENSNKTGRGKIERATEGSQELKDINTELGLKADATKSEALQAYDKADINRQTQLNRNLIDNAYAEGDSKTVQDYQKRTSQNAQDLGHVAVTTIAGASASAGGGQLVDKIVELFGANETTAMIVDAMISASGTQPLDLLANSMTLQQSSNDTKEVTIPPVTGNIKKSDAIKDLNSISAGDFDDLTVQETQNLFYYMMLSILDEDPNSGDSTTVSTPEQMYIFNIKDPNNGDHIRALNLEDASLVIALANYFPELFNHISLSDGHLISLEFNAIDEIPTTSNKWVRPNYNFNFMLNIDTSPQKIFNSIVAQSTYCPQYSSDDHTIHLKKPKGACFYDNSVLNEQELHFDIGYPYYTQTNYKDGNITQYIESAIYSSGRTYSLTVFISNSATKQYVHQISVNHLKDGYIFVEKYREDGSLLEGCLPKKDNKWGYTCESF